MHYMRTAILLAVIVALGACEDEQEGGTLSRSPEQGTNVSTVPDDGAIASTIPGDAESTTTRPDGGPQAKPVTDSGTDDGVASQDADIPSGDFGPNYPRIWEAEESEKARRKEKEE